MSKAKIVLIVLIVVLVGIQFIPLQRTNPPVQEEIPAPPDVKQVLQQSCYDCHSNQTEWPWYSYVAPVSFLVASDVNEGRRHLNFSTWNLYDQKKKSRKLDHVAEEVEEGEMPLWYYLIMHQGAKLSDRDKARIKEWINSRGVSLQQPDNGDSEEGHEH